MGPGNPVKDVYQIHESQFDTHDFAEMCIRLAFCPFDTQSFSSIKAAFVYQIAERQV